MKFLTALALIAVLGAAPAGAEPPKTPDGVPMFTKPTEDPVVEEVDDDEAKVLLAALQKAADLKDTDAILDAVKPMVTARNAKFVKLLDKLTKNRWREVRRAATEALGSQGPAKKVGPILYKVLMNRANKKEPRVLAVAIASLRRVGFDKKVVFNECKSHFKKVTNMGVMREAARYFGDLRKTEAFPMLIAWVEQPQPANVNSPTNPPASYWQRMHTVWMEVRLTVMSALKGMTGQEFELEKDWREWARTPAARRLGIK